MASDRLERINKARMDEMTAAAAAQIDSSIRQKCESCGRGGVKMAPPTIEDLEALIEIRDGFDNLRKNFTPAMADKFRRFDNTISYLHVMIAGSNEVP